MSFQGIHSFYIVPLIVLSICQPKKQYVPKTSFHLKCFSGYCPISCLALEPNFSKVIAACVFSFFCLSCIFQPTPKSLLSSSHSASCWINTVDHSFLIENLFWKKFILNSHYFFSYMFARLHPWSHWAWKVFF